MGFCSWYEGFFRFFLVYRLGFWSMRGFIYFSLRRDMVSAGRVSASL